MVLDICVLRCIYRECGIGFIGGHSIKKVGDQWWYRYSSYRKCSHTTVAHADSFRCTNRECGSMAVLCPTQGQQSYPTFICLRPIFASRQCFSWHTRSLYCIEHAQSLLLYVSGTGYLSLQETKRLILFGHMAQRIIKGPCDVLVANMLAGSF